MQEAVEPADVDERAEVGDVLDGALDGVALVEGVEQVVTCGCAFLFDELAARDDDVEAFGVDLEDDRLDGLVDEDADVGRTADIDLRCGQEDGHADIDEQAALDFPHDGAFDFVAFVVLGDDAFPAADAVGLAFG